MSAAPPKATVALSAESVPALSAATTSVAMHLPALTAASAESVPALPAVR